MRLSLTILLCLFLVHCSNQSQPDQTDHIQILDDIPEHIQEIENLTIFPGDSEPMYSVELIPVQSYGEAGEPYLTTLYDAVVDDQGRVIILNANTNTNHEHSIYVYNENGTFHAQLGRHGKGPGEYGFVIDLQFKAGKVFARDMTNERINIYNTERYDFDRTMMIEQLPIREHEAVQDLELGLIMANNDGNYLVSFSQRVSDTGWPIHKYLRMDTDGNALDYQPLEFISSFRAQGEVEASVPMSFMPMPFIGSTISGYSDEGELYSAWNHDFLIRKYDSRGIYQSAIYYPLKGSPFDLSVHTSTLFYNANAVMRATGMYDEELPETNPVLSALMVDDENRIWAAVPMYGDRTIYEWWILAPSGELLGTLQRPRDLKIFDIKDGYLYSKEIDEETDAEFVVKYRIEMKESSNLTE